MNKYLLLLLLLLLVLPGCGGNLSPRLDQNLQNQNGKIDDVNNGMMAEIGKIKQDQENTNSKLKDVQQGIINLKSTLSQNKNNGVQILQGDGALVLIFGVAVIGMLLYHYRSRAVAGEKTAEVLARTIAESGDPELHREALKLAIFNGTGEQVYHLLRKNQPL